MEHFISYKNACKIIGLSLVLALVSSAAYSQEGMPMKSVQQGLASIKPVISLSGAALTPPTMGEDTRKRLEENLAKAQAAYDADLPDEGWDADVLPTLKNLWGCWASLAKARAARAPRGRGVGGGVARASFRDRYDHR